MRTRRIIKYLANLATPTETTTNFKKWRFKNKLLRLARINIGNHVAISSGFICITGNEDKIKINDFVALGHNIKLYSFGKICIGCFSMLAADVSITSGGHDTSTLIPLANEVNIGRGCWIGHGARIIGPVHIGDNAIIGAGAVVVNDIPANAIAVGVPAKVIKFRQLTEKSWFMDNIFYNPNTFQIIEQSISG